MDRRIRAASMAAAAIWSATGDLSLAMAALAFAVAWRVGDALIP
jgi:hypothetical protein